MATSIPNQNLSNLTAANKYGTNRILRSSGSIRDAITAPLHELPTKRFSLSSLQHHRNLTSQAEQPRKRWNKSVTLLQSGETPIYRWIILSIARFNPLLVSYRSSTINHFQVSLRLFPLERSCNLRTGSPTSDGDFRANKNLAGA